MDKIFARIGMVVLFIFMFAWIGKIFSVINKLIPSSNLTDSVTINDRILFITFLGLIWYAWETRKMRLAMVSQLDFEQMPVLDFYYKQRNKEDPKKYFRVRNNGKGVAYNIKIKNIFLDGKKFEFDFEDPNLILKPGDEKSIIVEASEKKNGDESWPVQPEELFLESIKQRVSECDQKGLGRISDFKIIITCENSFNKEFSSRFSFHYKNLIPVDSFEILKDID